MGNIYFNCSSEAVGSREACGVPFSCCKPKDNEIIKNKQCGYDVRKPNYVGDPLKIINEKGCLEAGGEWLSYRFSGFVLRKIYEPTFLHKWQNGADDAGPPSQSDFSFIVRIELSPKQQFINMLISINNHGYLRIL